MPLMNSSPPFSRMAVFEKFVCMPLPFQSPLTGFGMQLDDDAVLLRAAVEQVAGQPGVVARLLGALAEQLVFPLALHHLGVDAGDAQARVEARVEMIFDQVAADAVPDAHGAVVRTLRTGVAVLREAQRLAVHHQRVFLLEAEPQVGVVLERAADVGRMERPIRREHFAHHQRRVLAAAGPSPCARP